MVPGRGGPLVGPAKNSHQTQALMLGITRRQVNMNLMLLLLDGIMTGVFT
jgi:hypothetical protein